MSRVEFDSTKKPLDELLKKAHEGIVQLPDFQRGWVWDDDGIRGLLASISQAFPVGALMALQTGGDVRFKPRVIEGAPEASASRTPEVLLLDGQQRITSLYQSTMRREVVQTINAKRQRIARWYYIDMRAALDPARDRMEAIVGVPEPRLETRNFGREVTRDLTTKEREFESMMFPVNRVFDDRDWQHGFEDFWYARGDRDKRDFYRDFYDRVLSAFLRYQMPVIELGSGPITLARADGVWFTASPGGANGSVLADGRAVCEDCAAPANGHAGQGASRRSPGDQRHRAGAKVGRALGRCSPRDLRA